MRTFCLVTLVASLPGGLLVTPEAIPGMVFVPPGEFLYGGDHRIPTTPRVADLGGYWIDRFEVSNSEYLAFVRETGAQAPYYWSSEAIEPELSDLPVFGVSWTVADVFCRWQGKRLPSEEEWEKAARGTDGRLYPWGDDADSSKCNAYEPQEQSWLQDLRNPTAWLDPVDSHAEGASPYGAYNMTGNVWKWTSTASGCGGYILRGGSCGKYLFDMQVTRRAASGDDSIEVFVGFRCAKDG